MASFRLHPLALEDIDRIWMRIFPHNHDAANAVEDAIRGACIQLAKGPLHGRLRPDLTNRNVRFWTVHLYPNYIVIYRPDTRPIEILRVVHGMRSLKKLVRGLFQ